jgi:glycosyltransferase involved in cell wall biosynthesis
MYDQCRLFVAPTRFSAGIPLKIIESVSQGLPVVATTALREQLGWTAGQDLWASPASPITFAQTVIEAYQDPEAWSLVQENGYQRVKEHYSPEEFMATLESLL